MEAVVRMWHLLCSFSEAKYCERHFTSSPTTWALILLFFTEETKIPKVSVLSPSHTGGESGLWTTALGTACTFREYSYDTGSNNACLIDLLWRLTFVKYLIKYLTQQGLNTWKLLFIIIIAVIISIILQVLPRPLFLYDGVLATSEVSSKFL